MANQQLNATMIRFQRLRASQGVFHTETVLQHSVHSIGKESCLVAIASGNLMFGPEVRNFQAPFSTQAVVKIAEEIVARQRANQNLTVASINAAQAGQLTALWMASEQTHLDDQEAAMHKALTILLRHPPSRNRIQAYFNHMLANLRQEQHAAYSISAAECRHRLKVVDDHLFDIPLADEVHSQKLRALELGANRALIDFLLDDNVKDIFRGMRIIDDNSVDVPAHQEINVVPDEQIANIWSALTEEDVTQFYHIMGEIEAEDVFVKMTAYLITSLFNLTKSGNVTERYLDRRIDQLATEFQAQNLNLHINSEIISAYAKMFPTTNLTADYVYKVLSTYYTIFKDIDAGPVTWMIEQSAASNVSAALAVAEMIRKNQCAMYQRLKILLGSDQFAQWAGVVGHLMYDRFSSIVAPPITVQKYADLAYIGIFVEFGMTRPGLTAGGYKGTPDKQAKWSKANLDRMALCIRDQSIMEVEDIMSIKSALANAAGGHRVVEANGEIFLIPRQNRGDNPDLDQAAPNILPNNQDQNPIAARQQADHDMRARINQLIGAAAGEDIADRAGWPRLVRGAPAGTVRMSMFEAATLVKQYQLDSQWIDDINTVAEQMSQISRQEVLPVMQENMITSAQRRREVPVAFRDTLTRLGFNVPPEWAIAPNPIPATQADVHDHRYNAYVRTFWPTPGEHPAPQELPVSPVPAAPVMQVVQQPPPARAGAPEDGWAEFRKQALK